jgi:choline dehydrogenase-like flavoprotein
MELGRAQSGSGAEGISRVQADVVILGMGAAGEDLGLRLTDAGLDVVGIEAELERDSRKADGRLHLDWQQNVPLCRASIRELRERRDSNPRPPV